MFLMSLELVHEFARTGGAWRQKFDKLLVWIFFLDWAGNVRNSFVWSLSKASTPPNTEASVDLQTLQTKYDSMLVLAPKEGIRTNFRESVCLKISNKGKVYNLNNNCYYFQKMFEIFRVCF
jgi:hypothetical protein